MAVPVISRRVCVTMSLRLNPRVAVFGLLIWTFVSAVWGLHADEAGLVDWHHKLIGTPLDTATFLHKPVVGSGALVYTLTDRDVLAAVNLRDGAIGNLQ
jgi:hypothetical protein